MQTPDISLSMIVKDSGNQLLNAINSAKIFCNEIIVLDTGSVDNTPKIASSAGAKVFFKKWEDNFALARNYTLNYALSEWIIILDDDEILDQDSFKASLDLFADSRIGGIRVEIQNITDSGKTSNSHRYTRIFRNRKMIKFEGNIHEQINQSIIDAGFEIVDSNIIIKHYGYLNANIDKSERNSSLLKKNIAENNNDDFSKYHYIQTLLSMKNYDEIFRLYPEIINSNQLSQNQKENLKLKVAQAYLADNQFDNALELTDFISLDVNLEGFRQYIRAATYMQMHDFRNAQKLYCSEEIMQSNMTDKTIIETAKNAIKMFFIA